MQAGKKLKPGTRSEFLAKDTPKVVTCVYDGRHIHVVLKESKSCPAGLCLPDPRHLAVLMTGSSIGENI
jgi:hypothetical protein